MAMGIKDKVAIIGMGCTHFGERWDVGGEELMVEAFTEKAPMLRAKAAATFLLPVIKEGFLRRDNDGDGN